MSHENKALVRRYFEEVWNKGDLGVVDEIVDPLYRGHDPSVEDMQGPDDIKRQVELLRRAFSDLRIDIEQQVAEGDLVATRWIAIGTHDHPFLGIPPTNRHARISGMSMMRIANGRLAEAWLERDSMSILRHVAPTFIDALYGLVSGSPLDAGETKAAG